MRRESSGSHTVARSIRRAGDSLVLVTAAVIFLAQQVAISNLEPEGASGAVRQALFFSTTVVLAGLALLFRRFWGAWLVSAGIILNLLPMAVHNGSMPIDYAIIQESGAFPEVTRDDIGKQTNHGKDIVLERDDIHFFRLSDRYVVELPWYGANIYSLGDFVLFAGVGGVVLQVLFVALGSAFRRDRPDGLGADSRAP